MNDSQPTSGQEPKKYIRTFASDLEMAEKGSAPPPPALPPPPTQPLPPPQPPTPPAPQPAHTTSPVQPAAAQGKPPPLQTYASDFSDRIQKTGASAATILAAEQDSLPPPPHIPPPESSRISLSYIVVGAGLVAASAVGIFVVYLRLTASQPVTPIAAVPAPILVDEREELVGEGAELLRSVVSSAARPITNGTVRLLYTASSTDAIPVFAALPLAAPDGLLRNVSAQGSMAGVINSGGNQSPFFILSISTYGSAFIALLSWEPLMPEYVSELFPSFTTLVPSMEPPTASSTAATTTALSSATTTETEPAATATTSVPTLSNGAFFDATVANHDVRVYRDSEGRDVFLYGFWNQSTLIIARDSAAFAEIVGRLATARAPS